MAAKTPYEPVHQPPSIKTIVIIKNIAARAGRVTHGKSGSLATKQGNKSPA